MSVRAPVTPKVIRWARETAKLSIEQAAAKIGRPKEDVIAWEAGSLSPTMAQARKAAQVYRRSLAIFYLPAPPKDWQVLKDFRTLLPTEPREYSAALSYMIRETASRQEWMREFLKDEGQGRLSFIASASLDTEPEGLAESIRRTLAITSNELHSCRTRDDALRLWIYKAEGIGIFVFRDRNIDCSEARGFALSDEYAPFIFLNSADAYAAQIFTLAHELAHLWINESGISNLEVRGTVTDESSGATEAFCNRVAGLVLLEPRTFEERWSARDRQKSIAENIEALSSHFRVSREAIARRLLDRRALTRRQYLSLRAQYHDEWLAYRERERERRRTSDHHPSPYRVLLTKNGRAFSLAILSAYYGGAISGREVSSLLTVKLNHLPKLADAAGLFVGVHPGESRA